MVGSEVTAEWGDICAGHLCWSGRRERHGQDAARYLSDHQPVGGWLGRVEQRLAGPHVAEVIQAQTLVLEQVTGLLVDLEGPVLVEFVIQATTFDYEDALPLLGRRRGRQWDR